MKLDMTMEVSITVIHSMIRHNITLNDTNKNQEEN